MSYGHVALFGLIAMACSACSNTTRTPEPNPPASTGVASARPAAPVSPSASASVEAPDAGAVGALDAEAEDASAKTAIPDDMLGVPGGTFMMGWDGRGAQKDEYPIHAVTLRPFLLDKTEVTNEAYFKCVEAGVCRKHFTGSSEANHFGKDEKFRTPKRPISGVSQSDAATYCKWVGKRLPTEAEFERASRGSDGRLYPWGNSLPTHEQSVFASSITEDVGTHPKGDGPYGHHDLTGNVWEWSADMYDPYAYRRPGASQGIPGTCDEIMQTLSELKHANQQGFTGSNPIPDECEYVLRGGAFNYDAYGMRASNRVHHPGRFRLVMSGMRCAKDWPDGPVDSTPPAGLDAGAASPTIVNPAPSAPAAPHKHKRRNKK
ncbi:MAG: SUMF1/EgtB/PvdO family nonheme iron enzyme [Deltaproteobacteria bacterium]|nr:SUMF1/EgtB/PvdO family nonheme iron enzyme [Deltaproteobacteria bacterium]